MRDVLADRLNAARQAVDRAKRVAVLTGAGVSAESGIPTFRSNGGYWQNRRFEDLATPQGFARDPKFVWQWYEERRRGIAAARPNAGHDALAALERSVADFTLITQNVDGLHDAAGSKNIIKLHGDIWIVRCTGCAVERVERSQYEWIDLPPRCACGAILRPGVVWFGEALPDGAMQRAAAAVRRAEVLIVAGTSAQVYPAAGLIPLAVETGATVIEINPEATGFSTQVTFALRGNSADILPQLVPSNVRPA
jgi:NAD-dependent deacetylase